MPIPPFKAVIWDLDGTLADSEDMHCQTWQITMASKGIDYSRAEFLADFGRTTSTVFAEYLGPDLEEAELERLTLWKAQLFRDRMANELQLLPGAESWLEEIRGQGLYQAVASAAPMASIAGVVQVLNIGKYFTALLSGVPLPQSKPDPALFLQAAAALAVPPSDCLVMEDSTFGVEAAHRAGMRCLVVGHRAQSVLEEIHSTLGICNCRAVADMSATNWQAACDQFTT